MANEQNLTPFNRENSVKNGKKGGIASARAKREKKAMRDKLELLLELPLTKDKKKGNIEKLKSINQIQDSNLDVGALILAKQIQKALKGDTRAAQFILSTINDKSAIADDREALIEDEIESGFEIVTSVRRKTIAQQDVEEVKEDGNEND